MTREEDRANNMILIMVCAWAQEELDRREDAELDRMDQCPNCGLYPCLCEELEGEEADPWADPGCG
ncbi:MAG: hypothetical protein JSU72_15235 [Deltaproteobacteria bacterium]|nr:MAG: hypothetical protein JSU72_15235 [Deltaproteobacteria bacterium]